MNKDDFNAIVENLKKYEDAEETVSLPEDIREIDASVLEDAEEILRFKAVQDLHKIGKKAFSKCVALERADFYGDVERVCQHAFSKCKSLTELNFFGALDSIESYAFAETRLTDFVMPDTVTSVADHAFSNCSSLESVFLSPNLRRIRESTFGGCTKLKSVVIPDSVTYISFAAFSLCYALESVKFSDNIKVIDRYAFAGCRSLTRAELPEKLEVLGPLAFLGCKMLETVIFPQEKCAVSSEAFEGCRNLKYIDVKGEIKDYNGSVIESIWETFSSTESEMLITKALLRTHPDFFRQNKQAQKSLRQKKKKIISDAIEKNDAGVLQVFLPLCRKIRLSEIDEYLSADGLSTDITAVLLDYKAKKYSSEEILKYEEEKFEKEMGLCEKNFTEWRKSFRFDVLKGAYGLEKSIVITGYHGKETEVVVPSEMKGIPVKLIGTGAFSPVAPRLNSETKKRRRRIKKVVISEGISMVNEYAFRECESLKSVIFPESVQMIGKGAFLQCTELAEVRLPSQLEVIDENTFESCEKLETVDFPENLRKISKGAFSYSAISTVRFPEKLKEIGEMSFSDCIRLTDVIFNDNLKIIGGLSFTGCTELTSLKIPESVETILGGAFFYCKKLSDITITDNTEDIGIDIVKTTAYAENSENYHKGVLYVGNHAVGHNGKSIYIKNCEIREGTVSIADNAFSLSEKLQKVIIPGSVRNIGLSAFENCSNLNTVILGDGVRCISENAFCGCERLMDVSLPDSLIHIGENAFLFTQIAEWFYMSNQKVFFIGNHLIRAKSDMDESYEIPSGICSIAENAFRNNENLKSVIIPDSVKAIGKGAFQSCSSLTSVMISHGVTEIGNYAFAGCENIKVVVIPESVTSIAGLSFEKSQNVRFWCKENSVAWRFAEEHHIISEAFEAI